jgi:hypothetical protein
MTRPFNRAVATVRTGRTLMTNAALRCGALVALVMLSTACGGGTSTPTAPTSAQASIASRTPAPLFPEVLKSARIFVDLNSSPLPSRYLLYENGSFALQYASALEYRGTYREASGVVTFEWEGSSAAGPWGATGSLTGDSLAVRYNLIMQLSDFEDAVYTRPQ